MKTGEAVDGMTDEDWERLQVEREAIIRAESDRLLPCIRHGKKAIIEKGFEGELQILAAECGCWFDDLGVWDSLEAAVDAWNERPVEDALRATIATQAARIVDLERMVEFWKTETLLLRDEMVERGDELDRLRAELAAANEQLQAIADFQGMMTGKGGARQVMIWTPIEDGIYRDAIGVHVIAIRGKSITTAYDYQEGCTVTLGDNYALCRQVPDDEADLAKWQGFEATIALLREQLREAQRRQVPDAASVPREVAQTMREALQFERKICQDQNSNTFVSDWRQAQIDRFDAALTWLQQHTSGDAR